MSIKTLFRKSAFAAAIAGAALVAPLQAAHAAYPDQPIKLVVPYPPGGATDVIGRIVAKALADDLNANVVVDNRGGASGSIGAAEVAKAKPDGYTLLMGALTSHSIYQNLYSKNANYDLNKDFSTVAIVGKVPLVFVVNPSVQAKNLAELIALAKKNPGKHTIASAGNGSPQHMASALFEITAGIDLIPVPYRGSGPAMTDLVGGQVDSMIETVPAAQQFIKSDKLRALAVTSQDRAPTLPDVPTAKEAGLENFDVSSMFGVLAPAGTPADRIKVITDSLQKALSSKELQDALLNQGVVAGYQNPQNAQQSINNELQKWAGVIQKAGIKAD
jgi:tripartite-type tricarboxylate transporter receptor subunit TctC